ncbi:MAG TPA: MmcQ/YjbR family DNA-binding protein [Caulobacteraceae bacterium]|nr:MmcQ/YjbR family DNA-binding protein [Caulobacteraceae bacterium]
MTWDDVLALALAFPGVEEGTSYGTPALKANGKFLTRLRAEDGSVVLVDVTFDEREMLMAAEPQTFHLTPHYQNYPSVLARLENLDPGTLRNFLERRWRNVSPKRVVKGWDETRKAEAS